VPTNL
jgi:hypothetical protein